MDELSKAEFQFDSVETAVAAIRDGEMVVVVDDDDRENEGDLIMAASLARPEHVAFMVRHTSGILCTPMESDLAQRLHLDPMVSQNNAPLSTAFTVSIDYRHGLTTGISAEERCNTVGALANSNCSGDDFVRPGHVFPLIARDGGVLVRSGHTEAGVDLTRLAGVPTVGLLAEIVNDDGTVKRLPALIKFAQEHDLRMISIADLIAWRQRREQLVECLESFDMATPVGTARGFSYRTRFDPTEHLAVVVGTPPPDGATLVRIHRERLIDDVFGSQLGHPTSLVEAGFARIAEQGSGIFLYLRGGSSLRPPGSSPGRESERFEQWIEIGVGAQILRDLGATRIRLLAGRQHKYVGLRGFGIEIEETVTFD